MTPRTRLACFALCVTACLTIGTPAGAQAPAAIQDAQDSIWLSGHSITSGTWTGLATQRVWVRNEDAPRFRTTKIAQGQIGHYTWLRMWVQWADDNYVAPRTGPTFLQRAAAGLAGVANARAREIDRQNAETAREDWAPQPAAPPMVLPSYSPPPLHFAPLPSYSPPPVQLHNDMHISQPYIPIPIYAAPVPRPYIPTSGTVSNGQVTGMTRQCFYTSLGSTVVHTVSSATVCPVTWP